MSSGPTFKFPLGSHGEVLPVCHSCWCLHRGNVWIDQDRLNASFFPVIWLMFSNLLKVMFATGFEEQEATTKSPQNKDVHFLGGNQTQRNQYSNSIVISVYSGGPSPAHQQWIPERFSSGSLHKKNEQNNFFTGIGGWGNTPQVLFYKNPIWANRPTYSYFGATSGWDRQKIFPDYFKTIT